MSKEIKKRVKDSEIEVAKSSNKKLFIITIIILLLIIVGLVLFLLYDYKIIFPPKDTTPVVDNNKKKITTTRHEDKYVDVDVDSPRIINLYNSVYSGNIDSYLFDSKKVIDTIYNIFGDNVYISIMNQYTPMFNACDYPEINKPLNPKHYDSLIEYAASIGIKNGFIQDTSSSSKEFVPDFNLMGI